MTQEKPHHLEKMAQLRSVLMDMERRHLPGTMKTQERDICYAVHAIIDGRADASASTEEIRSSSFCAYIAQATYNRALRSLIEQGFLVRVPNSNGRYVLGERALESAGSCCQTEADHPKKVEDFDMR